MDPALRSRRSPSRSWSWRALDAVTLGEWFGSVIENVRFNIVDGMARTFGVAPPYQYLTWLAASCRPRFGAAFSAWPASLSVAAHLAVQPAAA